MEKNISITNGKLINEFLSIFACGLTYCLENDIMDTARTEAWLFSPKTAYSLKKEIFCEDFIDAMKYSSELDACNKSECFIKSLKSAQDQFAKIIKKSVKTNEDEEEVRSLFLDIGV